MVYPSTIHTTLLSCSVLLFLLHHVTSKPSSSIFFCDQVLSAFFLCLSASVNFLQFWCRFASHPNFSPTAASGAIWMHLPRSCTSCRDFAESPVNFPPTPKGQTELSNVRNLSLVYIGLPGFPAHGFLFMMMMMMMMMVMVMTVMMMSIPKILKMPNPWELISLLQALSVQR